MNKAIRLLTTLLVVLLHTSMVQAAPVNQAGQISVSITPAYPKVMNGSTFPVRVSLYNIPMQGAHCVNVELTASGGFTVRRTKQYISHLTSSKDIVFQVKAPSSSSTGTLSVTVTWSQFHSCGGTIITKRGSSSIASSTPWKLTFDITKMLCVPYANDPAVYTVLHSESWRFTNHRQAKSPYVASINLHPSPGSYNVSLAFPCLGLNKERYFKSITKSINVTGSGQKLSFP